jgi:hypothetical protein
MSVHAAGAPRIGAIAERRIRMRSDRVALLGLAAWSVLLAALSWRAWGDLTVDTGYDLLAGANVARGDLPYADFVYYYGPLAPFLMGGLFAITGPGVGAAIALGLAMAAAIVVLAYRVARLLVGPVPAFLVGALAATAAFSTGNMSAVLPYTASAPLAVIGSLAALLCLARGRLVAAGVAGGIVCLTRPEFVAALGAAFACWLIARAMRDGRSAALRDAALIAAPALAIPALVYGGLLTQVSPGTLVTENLIPVDQLREGGEEVVRSAMPLTAASLVKLAGRLVLYTAGAAGVLILAAALRASGRTGLAARIAAGVAAAGFLAVLLGNPEAMRHQLQNVWGWIPAGAGLAALVMLARRRPDRDAMALSLAAFVAVLGATTYAQFFPFATLFPNKAAYAMPFAALFLAWVHVRVLPASGNVLRRVPFMAAGGREARAIGVAWLALLALAGGLLVARDGADETATVRGPGGALADSPETGPAYQSAVAWIQRETRPGEPVLIAPQMTWMYVVADRPAALPQLALLPGGLPAEDEPAAIERMRDVRAAVIDTHRFTEFGHGSFGETFDRRLAAWLRRDFRRVATLRGTDGSRTLELWQRREVAR